ncbi:MAG: tetratricopeptide repeat protein [Bacteroidetes bacterium]|nr:tetratricopeptide repeat protein [Bacteroidota bacterium]
MPQKFILVIVWFALIAPFFSFGQDQKLAQQYFAEGDYERALVLFKKLTETTQGNTYFLERYVDCLFQLKKYNEAEKVLVKELKKKNADPIFNISLGQVYEKLDDEAAADQQFQLAINRMVPERFFIVRIGNTFTNINQLDWAIKTYEKGATLLNDNLVFSYYLADLFRRKGDGAKMINQYLNVVSSQADRMDNIQMIFQRYLLKEDYKELKKQIYERIQSNPDAIVYPELLIWLLLQEKDFAGAFRQVKALDRKLKENGTRLFQFANMAANENDYNTAIEAYDYIVDAKGIQSGFYLEAKIEGLRCRRFKLIAESNLNNSYVLDLKSKYTVFLNELGRNRNTASVLIDLAELEAYYLNDLPKAIDLLTEVIGFPGINPRLQATAKLNLGDYQLMNGEIWEATLLYSQVDKAFQDDLLGQDARFRNARLSYYTGDFSWAQSQFDVLKASTSKFISNDALDLSVFIMDNLGLDTTPEPLKLYAKAELLSFQNQIKDAFTVLDEILIKYPDHSLIDDIWYLKGNIYRKERKYAEAISFYEKTISADPAGIRIDNALFALGELFESKIIDIDKARACYERIFIEFTDSLYAVEARKRYRQLRGDKIQ